MPKTTAELAASKAGETAETNGFGSQERPLRPAGLYELKNDAGEVVDRLIVKNHPKFGDSQASAAERVGYRFVRPATSEDVKEIEVDAKYLATENPLGGITADETLKGVLARLSAVEKENADLRAAAGAETTKGASDNQVAADSKEDAKAAGEQKVAETTGNPALDDVEDEGDDEDEDEGAEKPFTKLNRAELEELAEKEGITLPEEADTNAKIREVITKASEEKGTE